MKTFLTFLVAVLNVCVSGNYFYEFEGFSEKYNIYNLKALTKFLPINPVIIEGGGYEGKDTLALARKFPLGTIYVFEPLESAFPKLEKTVRYTPNVHPFNLALYEKSGTFPFYVCHGTYAQSPVFELHSSLLKPLPSSEVHLLGPVVEVNCVSLADFCAQHSVDQIDMLWLSTEGSELQILRSMQNLIDKLTLVYIHSQFFTSREAISLFDDVKDYLVSKGFLLLSHFYLKDIHGDALFIKKERFFDE